MRARRARRRVAALAGGGITAALLLVPVPVRAAQSETVTVPMRAESWYRPLPGLATGLPDTCDLPTGCAPGIPDPPVPLPSPYPEGFLHVGVGAGIEESRTYLGLDLNGLSADVEPIGGTLTLPITTDPTAGVVLPETAKVVACHVPSFLTDGVAGDLTEAPVPDCTIASPATYVAAEGDVPAALVVDLGPFAELWSAGVASLVLLPEEGLPPTETWHVAFSGRGRDAPDAVPITAQLELGGEADVAEDVEIDLPVASSSGGFAPPRLDGSASFAAPPLAPPVEPELVVTDRTPAMTTQPVVSVVGGRYAYPVVLLLPLLVAAAIAWAGRALTRDLAIAEA
jgi:hypothetical protein